MPQAPVSVGDRFGRLVVLRELESAKTPNGSVFRRVECACDCGIVKAYRLPKLRNGTTRSCGCLAADVHHKIHGRSGTDEHRIWLGIRRRCKDTSNRNYGGRGIRVCERWDKSFAAFLEDMGLRPSPEHSIDRFPNNNGNYEPGNCRWATPSEQARNTRFNVMVTHEGEALCVAAWAERFGISASLLHGRLQTGWTFEDAISVSPRQGDSGFYTTPISKRDANWYREYDRREKSKSVSN